MSHVVTAAPPLSIHRQTEPSDVMQKPSVCVSVCTCDFSDMVIAIKLKAHVHVWLIDLHVSVYVLLMCDLWGANFSGFGVLHSFGYIL